MHSLRVNATIILKHEPDDFENIQNIIIVSLVCCVLSKILNVCLQPSAVHQMALLHVEKQKQDVQWDKQ